ncbi:MAG: hypothetical protein HOP16_18285 [Acidobacteria bacterium]|nr:hypothetical protein [Acidobacteriota bacterium]
MEPQRLEEVLRNVDIRLARVEQILPTLATKTELQDAIAPLATKAELQEAIAPLATKVELQDAIAPLATKAELQDAIAPLATRAELQEVRSELRDEMRHEGERTRRHFDVVAERLEGHVRLIAEGQILLQERFEDLRTDLKADIAQLDRRVMRLEATR